MDTENLFEKIRPILEGLIFTSGEEGLSLIQIQSTFEECTRDELGQALELLRRDYVSELRGIELVKYGGRWKFVAKEKVYPYASRLYSKAKSSSLSNAAMEVLSLIAYRQPITRVEIDEIRGVSSELMLKKLQARDLIETCGNKDTVGRPLLYRVSSAFYDAFGLESLADLPECDTDPKTSPLFEREEESSSSADGSNENGAQSEQDGEPFETAGPAKKEQAESNKQIENNEQAIEAGESAGQALN